MPSLFRTLLTVLLISFSSPAPVTREWLAKICSTSVVPERGIPKTKIGVWLATPPPDFSRMRSAVMTLFSRSK